MSGSLADANDSFRRMIENIKKESAREKEKRQDREARALSYQFEAQPLVLFKDQSEHLDRQERILQISPVARDPSSTGLGKTECYFALAHRLGLKLWIVCPAHMRESVLRRREKYSEGAADIEYVFTYYDTANNAQVVDKNGEIQYALTRGNKDDGYTVTRYFKEAVKRGILLVFDEHHLTKNRNSARSQATGTLIRYVVEAFREAQEDEDFLEKFRTRVYLCSATHIDKKSQTLNLLINMGIVYGNLITHTAGVTDTQNYMLLMDEAIRLAQLEDYQKKSGKDLLRKLNDKYNGDLFNVRGGEFTAKQPSKAIRADTDGVMYEVTRLIILPLITSEMPPFIPRLTFNAFFDFTTRQSERLYLDSLIKMVEAVGLSKRGERLKALGKGLRMSQQACIPTAVDFLISFLKEKPTNKVCLVAKYLEGILDLAVSLFKAAGYGVLYMTGKTTMKQRDEILFKFQQKNSNHRVLLFTTQLASGFDAHDLDGDFERRIVMLRDYSPTDIDQAAGRFYRRNMKSFGGCYLFNSLRYGALQAKITEILTEKSQVLKEVSLDVFKKGMERNFPGFYPRCFINGYTIEKKGKQSIRHDILYFNEFKLKDSNGNRLSDEQLIQMFVVNEPLPLVDAPLSYLLDQEGKKRPVDETFKGLKGIYGLNTYTKEQPMKYERSLGSDNNPYDVKEIEKNKNILNGIFREVEELKSKRKIQKIKTATAGEDDLDDGIADEDDILFVGEEEEFEDYEEGEVLGASQEESIEEEVEEEEEEEEEESIEVSADDLDVDVDSGMSSEGDDDTY